MNPLTTLGIQSLKNVMASNSIEDVTMENNEEVLSKLKFIGYIQKDEKLNVRYMTKHPNNWHTALTRTLIYPDNRVNALKFVRRVIHRSFEIVEHFIRIENKHTSRRIILDLIRSQTGLLNMKYTYGDDTKFCCDMDVLIECVVTRLRSIQESHPDLFEIEEEMRNLKE